MDPFVEALEGAPTEADEFLAFLQHQGRVRDVEETLKTFHTRRRAEDEEETFRVSGLGFRV